MCVLEFEFDGCRTIRLRSYLAAGSRSSESERPPGQFSTLDNMLRESQTPRMRGLLSQPHVPTDNSTTISHTHLLTCFKISCGDAQPHQNVRETQSTQLHLPIPFMSLGVDFIPAEIRQEEMVVVELERRYRRLLHHSCGKWWCRRRRSTQLWMAFTRCQARQSFHAACRW